MTDTSVIITWFTGSTTEVDTYGFPLPVAADTELHIGLVDLPTLTVVPRSLKTAFQDSTATPYHYAEVTGLEPNTAYAYVALSNGQQAQQSSMQFPVGVGGRLGRRGRGELDGVDAGSWISRSRQNRVPRVYARPRMLAWSDLN